MLLQLAQRCSERTWLQLGLADVPDTWSPGAKNLRLDLLGELGFSESELSRDGDSLLRADVVLGRTETLLDDLVRAQVHFGYMPLLDTPALEIVYSTALEVAGRSFPDGKADVLLEGAEAVLPSLGCIDPIQLLSLRDSPLAGRFREQLGALDSLGLLQVGLDLGDGFLRLTDVLKAFEQLLDLRGPGTIGGGLLSLLQASHQTGEIVQAEECLALPQCILSPLTVSDIADVALDYFLVVNEVNVTNEFHRNLSSVSGFQGEMVVPDLVLALQFFKASLA